ncbi:unnamed protein product [Candida verbasci]|uniref:ATP-dependent permease MDL1 n=1 Tax=Candida verbasci TaxID=1227364 RepID=A0A9W4TTX2_9ASCO|nr:unnamed protein product [Candida verbasci]
MISRIPIRIKPVNLLRFYSVKPKNDVVKLLRLAKPESKSLFFALICLGITSATTMSLPLIIGKIIDEDKDKKVFGLSEKQFYSSLGCVFIIGATANFGRIYLLRSVGERLVARLRSRLFSKILSQDSYFFDVGPNKKGMKTGDLISRVANDCQIISKSLSMNISDGMRAIISGCVGLTMMWWVSWKLTMCMSLMLPPLSFMSWFYGKKIKKLSKLIQENIGEMTKVTEEKFNGIKIIQSFSQQKLMVHNYNQEIKKIFDSSMREAKYMGFFYSINGFIGNITMIGLLLIGTRLIGAGEMTIGDLSSFMMYAVYTGSSVFGLGNFYTELMKGIGAAERVFELVEYKPKINHFGEKVDNVNGDVIFKNINFKYPSREGHIFSNFNLHIKQGENVCIVGPSGSGKSTISQLLLRFYDPISGSIQIGDKFIDKLNLNSYRSHLGYVQQEPLLFSGTIKENIQFGMDKDLTEALKLSHSNFIDNLPNGLNTIITSAQLSGGQKQRISLARTLLREPKIIILDEATSALDSISEEMVMKNLLTLNEKGVTIISIAHRLSTIKNSDRIIVLNHDGEIVEDGSFEELYNNKSSEFNKLLKQK